MKKLHEKLKPWYVIALLVVLWWLAARLQIWNSYLLPAPSKVLSTLVSMTRKGEITRAVLVSLRRVAAGFLISFTLAFVCALVSAYAPGVAAYFRHLGNFFRNVPPLALISLLILWFGLGEAPKLIIIVLASFFPMTMSIATGFIQCDTGLLEVGQSMHFSKPRQFWRITLPASRLNILTGIRIGLGYSWRALIGAEMFAAAAGLGYMIVFAQQMSRSDKVLIGIGLIGLIGALSDVLLRGLIRLAGENTQPRDETGSIPEIPEERYSRDPDGDGPETLEGRGKNSRSGLKPEEEKFWVDIPVPEESGTDIQAGNGIQLEHVSKVFSSEESVLHVLSDVSLNIPSDAITVVLGKSGCGKTTLLRMVAGLDTEYDGEIRIPEGKKCAVVFQESRLMPWLRVRDNITFGLKKDAIREEKVRDLLSLTGLGEFERAKPAQLSGGMQQRTAIARALAVEPDYLLMDEPFAALDYFTRANMQKSLLAIQRRTGCGILFITHSIDEALVLADQILILGNEKIIKRYLLTAKTAQTNDTGKSLSDLKADILMNI